MNRLAQFYWKHLPTSFVIVTTVVGASLGLFNGYHDSKWCSLRYKLTKITNETVDGAGQGFIAGIAAPLLIPAGVVALSRHVYENCNRPKPPPFSGIPIR